MRFRPLAVLALAFVLAVIAAPVPASATVADSTSAGFLVRHEGVIAASPADVYAALTRVGSWWDSNHSWTGNAANLSMDARAGGCFCEKLPNGSVQHLTVVYADPGKLLRLSGGLGPLQAFALAGSLTFSLAPAGDGTRLKIEYMVGGYMPGGAGALAHPVDGVLGLQFARAKKYIETGKPE